MDLDQVSSSRILRDRLQEVALLPSARGTIINVTQAHLRMKKLRLPRICFIWQNLLKNMIHNH